jgi:hypothetical protein
MQKESVKKEAVQGAELLKGATALTVVKKKMTVAEKIDSLHKLEAMASKVEYLKECKTKLDGFANGQDGFTGAKLKLASSYRDEVTVSNPAIIEELVKIANMRLKELLLKAEKEIEEFEIA